MGDHSDAATWTLGAINDPVDIFLIIGANDRAAAEAGADQAVANANTSGLRLSYHERPAFAYLGSANILGFAMAFRSRKSRVSIPEECLEPEISSLATRPKPVDLRSCQ